MKKVEKSKKEAKESSKLSFSKSERKQTATAPVKNGNNENSSKSKKSKLNKENTNNTGAKLLEDAKNVEMTDVSTVNNSNNNNSNNNNNSQLSVDVSMKASDGLKLQTDSLQNQQPSPFSSKSQLQYPQSQHRAPVLSASDVPPSSFIRGVNIKTKNKNLFFILKKIIIINIQNSRTL